MLPYDEFRPYSMTDVPLMELIHVMVRDAESTGMTTTSDIVMAGVMKAASAL
jgi:hypothetical protein